VRKTKPNRPPLELDDYSGPFRPDLQYRVDGIHGPFLHYERRHVLRDVYIDSQRIDDRLHRTAWLRFQGASIRDLEFRPTEHPQALLEAARRLAARLGLRITTVVRPTIHTVDLLRYELPETISRHI